MDAGDKLKQAAILGALINEESKKQIQSADPDDLSKVAIQIEAASICVKQALDKLQRIPAASDWFLTFTLSIILVQLDSYARQIRQLVKEG